MSYGELIYIRCNGGRHEPHERRCLRGDELDSFQDVFSVTQAGTALFSSHREANRAMEAAGWSGGSEAIGGDRCPACSDLELREQKMRQTNEEIQAVEERAFSEVIQAMRTNTRMETMSKFQEGVTLGDVEYIGEAEKAIFVELEGDEIAIPKSQIHEDSELWGGQQPGVFGELVVTLWLAEQRGWA